MSCFEEIRSALLKETTDGTYKKLSSVKVSELVEPKVVIERRDWPGNVWGVYRAMGVMKGDWDKAVGMVKAMVNDVKAMNVMFNVKTVKVLEKEEGGVIQYRVEDLPWPLSNRETILYLSAEFVDDKTFVYSSRSVPGSKQMDKNNVLGETFISGLILQKLDGGKFNMWSIGGMDPKGNIPEKLVGSLVSDIAYNLGKFQKKLLK